MFPPAVTEYWTQAMAGTVLVDTGGLRVTVNADLPTERGVSVLTTDSRTSICLRPEVAEHAGLTTMPSDATAATVLAQLDAAQVRRGGADFLHYLPVTEAEALRGQVDHPSVRELTAADGELFAHFTAGCAAEDLDEAYVELDHWLVVGLVEHGVLTAAGSAYQWRGSALADVGVITHPQHRRHGHARAVVQATNRRLLELGYQPQYRCFHTNTASAGVALSAGMRRFGSWTVSPEA